MATTTTVTTGLEPKVEQITLHQQEAPAVVGVDANGMNFNKNDQGNNDTMNDLNISDKTPTTIMQNLQPPTELNILILGETGVGKSTWINAFANFLAYDSLSAAEAGDLLSVIPGQFTVCDEDFNQINVCTGADTNEVQTVGHSATQQTKIYRFPFDNDNTLIQLIDTPGIGDTRGVHQDKKNFQNILDTIGGLGSLHGICILLKPNNAKLNVMFRFCIKELLTYLHRDASKNIVFCFTNSRGTFYRPGDTMPPLKALLNENVDVTIPTTKSTVYCFDSEAYRFLAAVKNNPPVTFPDDEKENFSKSWEKSIKETRRMLTYIASLTPHPVQSTLNLNQSRQLVLKLTRPLAEISRNIQTNKGIVEDEKKYIEQSNATIGDLRNRLMTTRTEIEVTDLSYPMTVCSNSDCVTIWTVNEVKTTEYNTVCHDNCQLGNDVQKDTIGDPHLAQCWAMEDNGFCKHSNCGHSYREHLHVYYQSKQVAKQVEDEAVKEALEKNLSATEAKKKILEDKEQLIREYEQELRDIQQASVLFAYFLKRNAITPYNDAMEQYLDHLIGEEEDKVAQGGNRKVLDRLRQSKEEYIQEKLILEQAMQMKQNKCGGGDMRNALSPQEVKDLVERLKRLKHSGRDLKNALESVTKTETKTFHNATVICKPQVKNRKNGKLGSFLKWVGFN